MHALPPQDDEAILTFGTLILLVIFLAFIL